MNAFVVWGIAIIAAGFGGFLLGLWLEFPFGPFAGFLWGIGCGVWAGYQTMLKNL